MRKYVFISIGGGLGAMLRYLIKIIPFVGASGSIPAATLITNITGCFVLALILTVALQILHFDADIRLGIATGFLGGFTTFSTLCKETVSLLSDGYWLTGSAYLLLTLILGIGAGYLGIAAGNKIVKNRSVHAEDAASENSEVSE